MKKVPIVDDSKFKGMKLGEIRQYVKDYYDAHYRGKSFINADKNITVLLGREGLRHVLYARKAGYIKMKALVVIGEMIHEASYCNFKPASPDEMKNKILGYLNFKSRVIVEGSIYWFRIVVRMTTKGKFYYDHVLREKNKV